MKYVFCCIFFLFFCGVGLNAQVNLVPNPSFEQYDTCPDFLSQIHRATNWYGALPTPDYFNSCAPTSFPSVSVPSNYFGNHLAASGNAYAGIIVKLSGDTTTEILGTQLTNPLQVGVKYFVSFRVVLATQANPANFCGVNNLGVLFSTVQYNANSPAPVCDCAQIFSNGIIVDTLNWSRVTGSFFADSNYAFASIGRLFSNAATDSLQVVGTACNAYYYLDDVCVSTDSIYAYNFTDIEDHQPHIEFHVFPNPTTEFLTIQSGNHQFRKLLVTHVAGAVCQSLDFPSGSNSCVLDVSGLASGSYILSAVSDSNVSSFSFIKL